MGDALYWLIEHAWEIIAAVLGIAFIIHLATEDRRTPAQRDADAAAQLGIPAPVRETCDSCGYTVIVRTLPGGTTEREHLGGMDAWLIHDRLARDTGQRHDLDDVIAELDIHLDDDHR